MDQDALRWRARPAPGVHDIRFDSAQRSWHSGLSSANSRKGCRRGAPFASIGMTTPDSSTPNKTADPTNSLLLCKAQQKQRERSAAGTARGTHGRDVRICTAPETLADCTCCQQTAAGHWSRSTPVSDTFERQRQHAQHGSPAYLAVGAEDGQQHLVGHRRRQARHEELRLVRDVTGRLRRHCAGRRRAHRDGRRSGADRGGECSACIYRLSGCQYRSRVERTR